MITPRLECILKYVTEKKVADIGTDHAYIPIRLVQDKVCQKVIATDIKPGPVGAAKRHVEKYGLSDKIDIRLGAGLDPLGVGEAEQIIIAGMGGEMIEKILLENREKAKASKLILQPMNNQYELRKFLHKDGYKIICEDIATEGEKVYNLIIACAGEDEPFEDDFSYHIPKCLLNHSLFPEFLNKKIREYRKIITGNEKAANKDYELIEYYKNLLNRALELEKKESENESL